MESAPSFHRPFIHDVLPEGGAGRLLLPLVGIGQRGVCLPIRWFSEGRNHA